MVVSETEKAPAWCPDLCTIAARRAVLTTAENVTRRAYSRFISGTATNVEVTVGMDPSVEGQARSWKYLKIVIIEDTKLKQRDKLVLKALAQSNRATGRIDSRGLDGNGIRTGNRIETRMGILDYQAGFPTKNTIERLYDEMDYQRAVLAHQISDNLVSACFRSSPRFCTSLSKG